MKKIDLKNLIKIGKRPINLDSPTVWSTHFARDWKIVILTFAFGFTLISLFAWQVYLSDEIGGGFFSVPIENTDSTVRTINLNKLKDDLLFLEMKQIDFVKLKTNLSKVVDPSL